MAESLAAFFAVTVLLWGDFMVCNCSNGPCGSGPAGDDTTETRDVVPALVPSALAATELHAVITCHLLKQQKGFFRKTMAGKAFTHKQGLGLQP